ncbi:tRNA preQ1(34) S-adenosylmethionine ribosyltransferase-isomerase QueA [Candidatus Peregrinibacteria bacterium]|nr:tRNA preQ1(34) S-adenosylmethionine ribosyltransferase-isomerase QueA [Candidatus Peregrinibacteria bacterium]
MELSQFDFFLPEERIAQHPLAHRDESHLLYYDRGKKKITHKKFKDVLSLFGKNDVLVLNNSRVIPARIRIQEKEILLLEKLLPSSENIWKCMVRKGKFFQIGMTFTFGDGTEIKVKHIEENGLRHIQFRSSHFQKFLEHFGEMPTPPYIHEKLENSERYQTVYAKNDGSVAAPTAGLHFTPELLEKLRENGVQIEYVTLHVGAGTFLPVKTENITDHKMHSEWFSLSEETATRLQEAKNSGKKITAVGSTALRTLESCAENGILMPKTGKTELFLSPPAKFQVVDHLLTNFHLPRSTLIMLVAAFLSPQKTDGIQIVKDIYEEAIREKYRFYSFGDATLIW